MREVSILAGLLSNQNLAEANSKIEHKTVFLAFGLIFPKVLPRRGGLSGHHQKVSF